VVIELLVVIELRVVKNYELGGQSNTSQREKQSFSRALVESYVQVFLCAVFAASEPS
jgi:hypothetical protein